MAILLKILVEAFGLNHQPLAAYSRSGIKRRSAASPNFSIGLVCFTCLGLGLCAEPGGAKAGHKSPGTDLFTGTNVVRIRLQISREGMAALRGAGWGGSSRLRAMRLIVSEYRAKMKVGFA